MNRINAIIFTTVGKQSIHGENLVLNICATVVTLSVYLGVTLWFIRCTLNVDNCVWYKVKSE